MRNEFVLVRDEGPVLDGTPVLPDDTVDGGEEPENDTRFKVMSATIPEG